MTTLGPNPLLQLIPKPPPPQPVWKWATVTSTTPLQIRMDTEDEPLDAAPSTLAQVTVGDRVYVVIENRRATILGRASGGTLSTTVDTGPVSLNAGAGYAATSEGVNIARYGNQVTFSMVVKTTAATSGSTTVLVLPAAYRPAFVGYYTAYDGAANLGVYPSGYITNWTSLASGATLRLSASWYTSAAPPTPTA